MKLTKKRVVSFLLALALSFTATAPAFAQGIAAIPGGAQVGSQSDAQPADEGDLGSASSAASDAVSSAEGLPAASDSSENGTESQPAASDASTPQELPDASSADSLPKSEESLAPIDAEALPEQRGSGTAEDPYRLSTWSDFQLLSDHPDARFLLVADIDMAPNGTVATVKTGAQGFTGVLDGQGHTVKNLHLAAEDAALIDLIGINAEGQTGTVKNLIFDAPVIEGTNTAAVVAAKSQGAIENVHILGGQVTAGGTAGRAGAIAGYLGDTASLKNCASSAKVTGNEAGGLVGCAYFAQIDTSLAMGQVTGSQSQAKTGGIYGTRYTKDAIRWNDACWSVGQTGQDTAGVLEESGEGVDESVVGIEILLGESAQSVATGENPVHYSHALTTLVPSYGTDAPEILKVDRATGSYTVLKSGQASYLLELAIGSETYAISDSETVSALLPQEGWQQQGEQRSYFQNGKMNTGWNRIDGVWYYFNEEGHQQTGWQYRTENGEIYRHYYYDDYTAPRGWVDLNGSHRYFYADGHMATGWQKVEDVWYCFGETNGAQQTGWQYRTENGETRRHYYYDNYTAPRGWVELNGSHRYFYADGHMATGWQKVEDVWYCFGETNGAQQTGWQYRTENGETQHHYYYTDYTAPRGWVDLNGVHRYFFADGHMARGYVTIDGKQYCFLKQGAMAVGVVSVDGVLKAFGPDGQPIFGWQTEGSQRYYSDAKGNVATGWKQIEGVWYYFSQQGYQQTGWQYRTENGTIRRYYYAADYSVPRGWVDLNGAHRYFFADGHMATDWQQIDGVWYCFGETNGAQQIGWQYRQSGSGLYAYYYYTDYSVPTGWVTLNGKQRYFYEDGHMAQGWQVLNSVQFYFDNAGEALWRWDVENGTRYCVNLKTNARVMGWTFVGDKWFHLNETTGAQMLGWQYRTVDGSTVSYYYYQDGSAPKGWVTLNTFHRYFYEDGHMAVGWQTLDGNVYYFDAAGKMATGMVEIDGKKYYFTAEGHYVAAPTIHNVTYTSSGSKVTVIISAEASKLTRLHDTAYSWDGGKTWQSANTKTYPAGSVIEADTIQVRDAVGNITVYHTRLELEKSGPYTGIDVSVYQGVIDWKQVKESGVDFAIIRALTWSNTVGYYVIDPNFEYNVRNAKANGIKVGAYLFSYAFSEQEIATEVEFFHNSKEMQSLRADNIKFDYPVYIDYEWNRILSNTTYESRTRIVRLGMQILEKKGYYPGFYASHNWATTKFNGKALVDEGYDFWYARYLPAPNLSAGTKPLLGYAAPMWQYSSEAKIAGISGNVDINICYVDYTEIIHAGGSSGSVTQPTLSVYDLNSKAVVTGVAQQIISQIVMNEVGGFRNKQVYQAQAVAAYSWVLYQQQHGNAIPAVGLATPTSEVTSAVKEVLGKALYYDSMPINAMYGAASAPYTNTMNNMWGSQVMPYLNVQVQSPESNYRGRTKVIPLSTMRANVVKMVGAALADGTPHSQWITDPRYDSHGYVTSIKVCGQTISGAKFYDDCYLLYSPNFRYTYSAQSDSWTFTTDGFGHCIGMSQYGANTYAVNSGWNYQQILSHYYPGTTLK